MSSTWNPRAVRIGRTMANRSTGLAQCLLLCAGVLGMERAGRRNYACLRIRYYGKEFFNVMSQVSAGLLMYRIKESVIEVFLVHPGGPFWVKKDLGTWSIPKGLVDKDEDALVAARREFHEETSFIMSGPFIPLRSVRLPSGKIVHAWAVEGDCDAREMRSNNFNMEWPPHSGRQGTFPEVDRGAWFGLEEAGRKISKGQKGLLTELQQLLSRRSPPTITPHS